MGIEPKKKRKRKKNIEKRNGMGIKGKSSYQKKKLTASV